MYYDFTCIILISRNSPWCQVLHRRWNDFQQTWLSLISGLQWQNPESKCFLLLKIKDTFFGISAAFFFVSIFPPPDLAINIFFFNFYFHFSFYFSYFFFIYSKPVFINMATTNLKPVHQKMGFSEGVTWARFLLGAFFLQIVLMSVRNCCYVVDLCLNPVICSSLQ